MDLSTKQMPAKIPYPDGKGKADIAKWRKKYDSLKVQWLREVFEEINIPLPEWCEKEGIIGVAPPKKLEVFRVLKEYNVSGMGRDAQKLKDFLNLSGGEYKYCSISGKGDGISKKDENEMSLRLSRIEDTTAKILALLQSQSWALAAQAQSVLDPLVDVKVDEPVQKMDKKRRPSERCQDLISAGVQKDMLKAYILRVPSAAGTMSLNNEQWNGILTSIECMLIRQGKDKVNSFLTSVSEKEKSTRLSPDFMRIDTSIDLEKFKKQLNKLVA